MRFNEFKTPLTESIKLTEGARIEHLEDLVFRELPPSKGANRALQSLINMEKGGHTDVTVKWDGSPAVIFGRNDDGDFIFTDKSGFTAKGYDGKAKSTDDVETMLKNRPGYEKNPEGYGILIDKMKSAYTAFEKATPKDYKGFFKGDMLYFDTPKVQDGHYVFTPNIVTYKVTTDSSLGEQIGAEVSLNIIEIRKPELDAKLVADGIAQQLERRVMYRRAMKRAMQKVPATKEL